MIIPFLGATPGGIFKTSNSDGGGIKEQNC